MYDVFTAQYKVVNAQLENMKKTFEKNMRTYQSEIDPLLKRLAQLVQQNYPLEMLIDILIFSVSIETGTLACSPLDKILTGMSSEPKEKIEEKIIIIYMFFLVIKNIVIIDMELLSSDDGADVFIVGKLLKKQGEFLSSYSESLIYM